MEKFFQLLYGPFAHFYDLIAWLASMGHWQEWIFSIKSYIHGKKVLELGSGPGYLLSLLSKEGFQVIGIECSPQMIALSNRKLKKDTIHKNQKSNKTLIRGLAGQLPFYSSSFDTIVSTFPTAYIFDETVLHEIKRVLKHDGRLIILLAAYPRNDTFLAIVLSFIYRITGQTISDRNLVITHIQNQFSKAGIKISAEWVSCTIADLLFIKA